MRKIILTTLFLGITNSIFAQYYTSDNFLYVNSFSYYSSANGGYDDYSYSYQNNTFLCPGNIQVRFEFSLADNKTLDYDDVDYFNLKFTIGGTGDTYNRTIYKSSLNIYNQRAVFYGEYPTSMLKNATTNGYAYQFITATVTAILKVNSTTIQKYQQNGSFIREWYAPKPLKDIQFDLCVEQLDSDGDGLLDINDNCPSTFNSNQLDTDSDGIGDVCDNCINLVNTNQIDTDNDGIGDVCDNDDDNDGILDDDDNCPFTPNNDQIDTDNDGIGDVCDEPDNNNSLPNLTLSKVTVKVGSTTYDTSSTDNSKTKPIFKNGEEHTFSITIENDDDGDASSSNYDLLVSEGTDYPNIGSKPVYFYKSGNAGNIDGNSEKTDTFSEYIYGNISTLNLEENKTYYLIVDIDPDNNVNNESNETTNDNIHFIEFEYKKSTTGKMSLNINNSGIFEVDYNYSNTTNNLKILDINYNSLVYNINIDAQNPTLNLYLFDGLYAVYVNDSYIKKIKVKGSGGVGPIPYPDEPYDSPSNERY